MPARAQHSAIATLSGTPKDVQALLARSHAERVLVMSFDHIAPPVFDTLAENVTNVATSMLDVLHERQEPQSLERLAQALVPHAPPPPHLLKEAAMLVRARRAVLESGDWLTAADIAQLAGFSTRNPSAQPNKWKKQGLIFAIHHNGVDYFPGYGLDSQTNFRHRDFCRTQRCLGHGVLVFGGQQFSRRQATARCFGDKSAAGDGSGTRRNSGNCAWIGTMPRPRHLPICRSR